MEEKSLLNFLRWQLNLYTSYLKHILEHCFDRSSHCQNPQPTVLSPSWEPWLQIPPVIKQPQWPQSTLASVTLGVRLQGTWLWISLWRTLSAHTCCGITMIRVGPSHPPFHSIVDILPHPVLWWMSRSGNTLGKGYESTKVKWAMRLWDAIESHSYCPRRNANNLVTLS